MHRSSRAGVSRLAGLVCAIVALAATPTTASAVRYEADGAAVWRDNAAPMGWSASLDRIIYNSRGADGLWDAYSADPDGGDPRCLTCDGPVLPGAGTATQRGAGDVDPSGDLMLLTVERGQHFGTVGGIEAEPGKGAFNDIWLARTDGTRAWPLTDIAAPWSFTLGTMWPRFDRTGTKVVWAELYFPAILNLGAWRLKTADIVWDDGTPRLDNVRTYEPEGFRFYEPYGFSPDNRQIIFASDLGMEHWWDSQIYTVPADFSEPARRLSPDDPGAGMFRNYNEFAYYVPEGDRIMYGRTHSTSDAGLDFWMMHPDGSDQHRLTYMNEPWNALGRGYSVVGGVAFDPRDPSRFVAGVAADPAGQDQVALMFRLGRYDHPAGLVGRYYAGFWPFWPVATRIENPSLGFRWTQPPASGIPDGPYAVRWTGTIDTPQTGTYRFCVRADDGAKLWLDERLVLDGWNAFGGRQCADVDRAAGQRSAIRLDYWNLWGDGVVQLTWTPPGGTPAVIPAGQLTPDVPGD